MEMVMNSKEKESPLEGNLELKNSVDESKGEQNLGVVTVTRVRVVHRKYRVPFLSRMEGDDGVCTYALCKSLSL